MSSARDIARKIPGLHSLGSKLKTYVNGGPSAFPEAFPAGHFYSVLPNMQEIMAQKEQLFSRAHRPIAGVDLREAGQLAMLDQMAATYGELPFPDEADAARRYYYNNPFFAYGDAIVLYSMLRHFKPRRVVEVGSGFSSAVMLDTNDQFLSGKTQFTFIDPYPERLLSLLTLEDKRNCQVLAQPVQAVPLEPFTALEADDILFIDSSHVMKIGSDLGYLLFEALPRLRPGVIVHFHDIFWPFEYLEEWVREGRAWNEAYLLRAFLQFNTSFEILYHNTFMSSCHKEAVQDKMPLCLRDPGGSIWLKRVS